jgi:hypothetical protein
MAQFNLWAFAGGRQFFCAAAGVKKGFKRHSKVEELPLRGIKRHFKVEELPLRGTKRHSKVEELPLRGTKRHSKVEELPLRGTKGTLQGRGAPAPRN